MNDRYLDFKGVVHSVGWMLVSELDGDFLAADLFQYIAYWVLKNEQDDKHKFDGKYWTYFSLHDLQASDYRAFSDAKLKRALNVLVDTKLVTKGNYNKSQFDRTPWYTVDRVAIEYYNPNLIKLFDKRKNARRGKENQPSTSEISPVHERKTADGSIYRNTTIQTTSMTNQKEEKKDSCFLNNHQVGSMVVVEVDNARTRETSAFTDDQWKEINDEIPKGMRYEKRHVPMFYQWRDEYGFKPLTYAMNDAKINWYNGNIEEYFENVEKILKGGKYARHKDK